MAKHLLIAGVVQGVGYRQWLCGEAQRLGVAGWVRNRRDGRVEAMLAGSEAAVAALLAAAEAGPPAARVSGIEVQEAEGEFIGFQWRSTE